MSCCWRFEAWWMHRSLSVPGLRWGEVFRRQRRLDHFFCHIDMFPLEWKKRVYSSTRTSWTNLVGTQALMFAAPNIGCTDRTPKYHYQDNVNSRAQAQESDEPFERMGLCLWFAPIRLGCLQSMTLCPVHCQNSLDRSKDFQKDHSKLNALFHELWV